MKVMTVDTPGWPRAWFDTETRLFYHDTDPDPIDEDKYDSYCFDFGDCEVIFRSNDCGTLWLLDGEIIYPGATGFSLGLEPEPSYYENNPEALDDHDYDSLEEAVQSFKDCVAHCKKMMRGKGNKSMIYRALFSASERQH